MRLINIILNSIYEWLEKVYIDELTSRNLGPHESRSNKVIKSAVNPSF